MSDVVESLLPHSGPVPSVLYHPPPLPPRSQRGFGGTVGRQKRTDGAWGKEREKDPEKETPPPVSTSPTLHPGPIQWSILTPTKVDTCRTSSGVRYHRGGTVLQPRTIVSEGREVEGSSPVSSVTSAGSRSGATVGTEVLPTQAIPSRGWKDKGSWKKSAGDHVEHKKSCLLDVNNLSLLMIPLFQKVSFQRLKSQYKTEPL